MCPGQSLRSAWWSRRDVHKSLLQAISRLWKVAYFSNIDEALKTFLFRKQNVGNDRLHRFIAIFNTYMYINSILLTIKHSFYIKHSKILWEAFWTRTKSTLYKLYYWITTAKDTKDKDLRKLLDRETLCAFTSLLAFGTCLEQNNRFNVVVRVIFVWKIMLETIK